MKLLRPALGFLTVMTLALTPAVSPVGPFVYEAQAASCTPAENVVSGKQVLTFTNSTSCTWTPPEGVTKVDYLIVAGGGGGGSTYAGFGEGGGGGGGGGLLTASDEPVSHLSPETIQVGQGGAVNNAGANTVALGYTAIGGGRGGYSDAASTDPNNASAVALWVGGNGGSGGGGHGPFADRAGGSGTSGQGSQGGVGLWVGHRATGEGGGGGGAGGPGGPAGTHPNWTIGFAKPGPGVSSSITGSAVTYAYGGPGGNSTDYPTAYTTPGSGGKGGPAGAGAGATGGQDGLVVLSYSFSPSAPTSTSVSSGNASIAIDFDAPTHWGGGTLAIEYSTDNGVTWRDIGQNTDGPVSVSNESDGDSIQNNTLYTVKLRAKNTLGGTSYLSSEVAVGTVIPSAVGEILRLDATHPDSYGGSGTTWSDLAGSLDGTLTNGPTYSTREKAFQFDGTDDYVDLPDLSQDFSNGFAVHVVADFGDVADTWERLIDFGNGPASDNFWFGRYIATNDLAFETFTGGTSNGYCKTSSGNAIVAGVHVYSVVLASNGDCSIYRDGSLLSTTSGYKLPTAVVRTTNFVAKSNWVADDYFEGTVQSVALYNTSQTTPTCYPVQDTYDGNGTNGTSGVTYTYFEFRTVGSCSWTPPAGMSSADVLVVGGGGGGAGNYTGGFTYSGGSGGGGGVYPATGVPVSGATTVTVGRGGSGGPASSTKWVNAGEQGGDSAFGTLTSGGGGGGGIDTTTDAWSSGSTINGRNGTAAGNGGSPSNYWGAYSYGRAGTASPVTISGITFPAISGNRGGGYSSDSSTAGSSASAGGAGSNGTYNTSGSGVTSYWNGSTTSYGAGGASWNTVTHTFTAPISGTGTGGDGARASGQASGLDGASGSVIVRYATAVSVTFASNGGSGSMAAQTVPVGTSTALSSNSFTRAGYTFAGWDTAANGSGTDYSDAQAVSLTQPLTLYAQWSANSLTVSWNSNGGSAVSNSTVNTGSNLSAPTPPSRAGYYFDGWSATDGGSVVSFPYSHPNTSDFTMYAVWEGGPLLAYEPFSGSSGADIAGNSGSGSSGFRGTWATPNAVKQGPDAALSGQYVSLTGLGLPSNTGFSRPSANTGIGGPSPSTWKLRYTARELERPISFDSVGTYYYSYALHKPGSGSAMVGFLSGLPANSSDDTEWSLFAGSGYSSKYAIDYGDANVATWVTGQSRQVTSGYNYSAVSAGSTALTTEATAQFMLVKISTVASGSDEVKLKVFSAADSLPVDDSAIAWDVSFSGAISGTANYVAVETEYSPVVDEFRMGLTYDSVTDPYLSVTWESNGGSSVSNSLVKSGGTLAAPADPTRSGYLFSGWAATDGGSAVTFPYVHPNTANFTMYALWTSSNYSVSFQAGDDGSGSNRADTKVHGTALTLPNAATANSYFTRTGYTVVGWSTNSDGSTTDYALGGSYTANSGITLYPVWSRASYTFSFDNNYSGSSSTITYHSGDTITFPSPNRLGYTLNGWYTAASGGTKVGNAGETYSPLTSSELILRYELDDPNSYTGSGTSVTDTSAQVNSSISGSATGTLVSGPTFSALDGMYLEFDGSSDYVLTGNLGPRVGSNADISLFAWVYPTGTGVIVTELGQTTISPLPNALVGWHDSQIEVVGSNLKFSMWGGQSDPVITPVTLNTWQYVGITYSSGTMRAYVDGSVVGTKNFTRLTPAGYGASGLYYGLGASDTTNMGDGTYGDFRLGAFHVYNTGLNASQVLDNYQATCARFDNSCSQRVLYAQWQVDNYTMTYAAGDNGSGSTRSATKIHGTALTLPDSATANSYFTRTGYAVVGWSTNSDGSTTDYSLGGSYTTDSGTTLYPVWAPNFCFVPSDDTFVNSGSGGGTAYGSSGDIVLKNAVRDTGSRFNRLGYLKFEYDPSTAWSGATLELTVSGSSDGGNTSWYNGVNQFQVNVYGISDADWNESSLTFNSANAESSEGWGINTSPWPWAPDSGTLLGTIDVPSSTSTIGNTYGLASSALDTFLNNDSDGDVTFFLVRADTYGQPNLSFATKENATHNAPTLRQYSTSCAYPITYRANGGGGTLPDLGIYVDGGSSYSVAAATNVSPPSGKIFSEWNTRADGSGTSYSPSDSYSATSSLTLYAQYLNQYTITFNKGSGGGAAGADQTSTKTEGTALTLPNAATANTYFTRTGYTVTGWATNADGSGTTFALGGSYATDAADTLYPVWTLNTYTVTFSKGSASGAAGSDQTDTKSHFADLTLPNSATANSYFTRTGYTVTGWATNADGSGTTFSVGGSYTTEAADTLYPIWTLNTYTITYAKGSVSDATGSNRTATKTHDSALTLPNSVTANSYFSKTGYTVTGWSTSADGSTSDFAFGASYTTEGDATLYPVWTPDTYTVTYDYNGATGGNSTSTSSYTVDSIVVSLPNPTKTGYTFGGWYSDDNTFSNSVGVAGASYAPSGDITIHAKWTATTFTVVYEYNGATAGNSTTDDDYTTGGTAITLPTPTRDGYTFGGWYAEAGLSTSVGAAGASYSPTSNRTIYAKWTAVNRSVTYASTNKTGGSAPTDSDTYIIGDTVVVKGNTGLLVRTGYTFAGWTVASDGSGTLLNAGSTLTVSTSNITLYPKWSPATFTITYHPNGGAGTLSKTSDSYTTLGTSVTFPTTVSVSKTGYTFAGWALTPTGSAVSSPFTTTSDVTLYARWIIKDISYTFGKGVDGAGSSLSAYGFSAFPADDMDPYGTSVTLPSTDQEIDVNGDSVTDHQFGGWSDGTSIFDAGDPYILGDADVSFVAQWIRVYSVRYVLAGGSLYGADQLTDSECVGSNDTCTDGQTITLNRTPTRAGYTFLGWEDQSGQLKAARASTAISSSSYIFTAKWDAIDYSVSFDSAGGSISIPLSSTNNIGDLITLQSPGTKTGYTLSGWEDSSGVLYAVGTTYRMGASSESFEAQWIPDVYAVTYDWQGGASSTPKVSDSYTVGTGNMSLPTASANGYTRDGYTFSGWSTSPTGSLETAFQPTADDVLYAIWADGNYTLSYNPSGGTIGSGTGTVPRTSTITLPTPVRDSFTFVGWYDAASGGNLLGAGGASFTPDASQTLYARWVQDSLYGVDLATLETANTYTASNSTSTDTTINHGPSNSSARVQIPIGALPNGTVVTVRYFKDTERQADLIPGDNTYFFSLLVSWLYGSGNSATVPDTASGKPITVTLTNSNIKAGAMVYQVIGETVTELGRATVDGSVTVELTEDPELVVAATKPDAPTSVSGSAGDTRATVSWTAGGSGGQPITGYTVTASPGGATCVTASTSCTISSLTNNTAYTFTVRATNAIGTSVASTASSAVTPVGANYTVTFDSNGGSSVSAGSFFSGSTVSAPSSPSRSGYTFQGWSTVLDDDSTEVTFPYAPGVTQAITLYALWDVAPASSSNRNPRAATPTIPTRPNLPIVVPPRATPQVVATPGPLDAPVIIPSAPPAPNKPTQASVGGRSVEVRTIQEGDSVKLSAGRVEVGVSVPTPSATSTVRPNAATSQPEIVVSPGDTARVDAKGLLPGSSVQVWLPGADERELSRATVGPDGNVRADVSLVAPGGEKPIPIGPQVLQVTGFDEQGNQTVIDMTITIVQGAPAPELNREANALPDLQPGQTLATSAGEPEVVTVQADTETREVSISTNEWSFKVSVPEESGTVSAADEQAPTIRLIQARTAEVNGEGFQPDTRVDVFLFSEPTLLGSFTVKADGTFDAEVFLDARFAVVGDHTLQIQGVGTDGYVKAANLGVLVEEPPAPTTASEASVMLWWVLSFFVALALVLVVLVLIRRRAA